MKKLYAILEKSTIISFLLLLKEFEIRVIFFFFFLNNFFLLPEKISDFTGIHNYLY